MTCAELSELHAAGAVGEICARFYDINGGPCATSLDRRMVAPDLEQLRSIPLIIGVACGHEKAAAILGAVRGGYVKTLVTDDVTAVAILSLAGADLPALHRDAEEHSADDARCSERTPDLRAARAGSMDKSTRDQGAQRPALLSHRQRGPSGQGR